MERVPKGSDNSQNPSYDAIINAARELFVEVGFPATSMDAIARRAAVVRATVYNNFADKNAILAKIIADYQEGYAAIPSRLRPRVKAGDSSFELIEATIAEAFDWRIANAKIRPLLDFAKALPTETAWNEANEAADRAMRAWFATILRRDAKRDMLRDGFHLPFASAALYGMIDGALASSDVKASRATIRGKVRQLALLCWYAIYRVEPDSSPTGSRPPREAPVRSGA
jgi:AcrR family transcriptional regulator